MSGQADAIDPTLRIRAVTLAVGDLARSVDFYSRVLGLPAIDERPHHALLGPDPSDAALELIAIDEATAVPAGSTGLFHVAWLHPSRLALASTVRRVAAAGWSFDGASDHGVSEALYLHDPDGLGIELYADRPREEWSRPADGHGVNMVTLPLDLDDLLEQAPAEPTVAMPMGTAVGHVHLQVSDVARTEAFYTDALGFEQQALLPSAAFVSAGGYHHHVGLNSWHSRGGASAPDSAPGLRRVQFELSQADALDALARRLSDAGADGARRSGDTLSLRDPDGQLLAFSRR